MLTLAGSPKKKKTIHNFPLASLGTKFNQISQAGKALYCSDKHIFLSYVIGCTYNPNSEIRLPQLPLRYKVLEKLTLSNLHSMYLPKGQHIQIWATRRTRCSWFQYFCQELAVPRTFATTDNNCQMMSFKKVFKKEIFKCLVPFWANLLQNTTWEHMKTNVVNIN